MLVALNIGSSSAKFALFAAPKAVVARGQVFASADDPTVRLECAVDKEKESAQWTTDNGRSADNGRWTEGFLQWAEQRFAPASVDAVVHRIVHGGEFFRAPVRLDNAALEQLDAVAPLAPLHVPPALRAIRGIAELRPGLAQVGCFDTAFHADLPAVRRRFAIPRRFADLGVVRYGFHGLSYQNAAEQAPRLFGETVAAGRLVALHLGAGASGCAMKNRRSQNTTMGLTALDGLVMGTRCGAIDPGVVLHLIRARGMSPAAAEELLTRQSGLLGLSGISADLRVLRATDSPAARFAVEAFCEAAARSAAALACDVGGLDALIFTGGVGEHQPAVRAAVCARLEFLGVRLDAAANEAGREIIGAADAPVAVAAVAADEEAVMARDAFALLADANSDSR